MSNEISGTSERAKQPQPHIPHADMTRIAMFKCPKLHDEPNPKEVTTKVTGPFEGKIVEKDGQKYRYQKVLTGNTTWDDETKQLVPLPYSLKTWFSHSTEGVGPGPGWDSRLGLADLSDAQMLERYGHVFTHAEIFLPRGHEEIASGLFIGGMPDDILYFKLVSFEEE